MVRRYNRRVVLTLSLIAFTALLVVVQHKSVPATQDNPLERFNDSEPPSIPTLKLYSDKPPRPVRHYTKSQSSWSGLWPHKYGGDVPSVNLLSEIQSYMDKVSPPVFNFTYTIPRIIHQTWTTTQIPVESQSWISRWQKTNPDYLYIYWTDKMARDFIKKYYTSLLEVYDGYKLGVQRADLFRYVVLFSIGGIYADIDVEPLRSLEPLRDWSSCILSREPDAHHQVSSYDKFGSNHDLRNTLAGNAIMASRPGHPFLFYLISKVVAASPKVTKKRCRIYETLWCTGPWIVTKTWAQYSRSLALMVESDAQNEVFVPESKIFLPTFDDDQVESMMNACQNKASLSMRGRKTCMELEQRNFENFNVDKSSYTRHWWYHSYHHSSREDIKTCHILDAAEHAHYFFEIEYEFTRSYL